MGQVSGVVQEIQTRQVAGGKTAYNLVVNGQSFGAGLFAPKCKQGDYVTFDEEQRGNFTNVAARSLKVGKAPDGGAAAPAAAPALAYNTGGGFDKRQDAISRQAASNTAIAFLQLLAGQDALPVPVSKSKGDKQAAIEALLAGYEQRFYENNTGVVWKDISPGEKAVAGPVVSAAEPEDTPWGE